MTTKQTAALDGLKAKLAANGVDLTGLLVSEGKKVEVLVGAEWPVITIGNGGGFDIPTVRSYPKADVETMAQAKQLLEKQVARDAKRAGVGTSEVVVSQPAVEEKKAETPKVEEPKEEVVDATEMPVATKNGKEEAVAA